MEVILQHSLRRATEDASLLWSIASTQYPQKNDLLQQHIITHTIEVVSAFAINARRVIERLPSQRKFELKTRRWNWQPSTSMSKVTDFVEALHFIIHAKSIEVGVEDLPSNVSIIDGGAVIIPYILATTDRRKKSYIDPFALSHCFFYEVINVVQETFPKTDYIV